MGNIIFIHLAKWLICSLRTQSQFISLYNYYPQKILSLTLYYNIYTNIFKLCAQLYVSLREHIPNLIPSASGYLKHLEGTHWSFKVWFIVGILSRLLILDQFCIIIGKIEKFLWTKRNSWVKCRYSLCPWILKNFRVIIICLMKTTHLLDLDVLNWWQAVIFKEKISVTYYSHIFISIIT